MDKRAEGRERVRRAGGCDGGGGGGASSEGGGGGGEAGGIGVQEVLPHCETIIFKVPPAGWHMADTEPENELAGILVNRPEPQS